MGGPLRVTLEWKGCGPLRVTLEWKWGWVTHCCACVCAGTVRGSLCGDRGWLHRHLSLLRDKTGRPHLCSCCPTPTDQPPPPLPQATDYPWPIINKLLYHGRRFKVRYHPEDDLEHWEIKKHKFNATETRWSKRIWKECVEQHTFFRLAVPGEPPLPIPQFIPQLGRNSKLRFSGRTLAQMRLHNKPSPGVSFPRWVDSR